MSYVRIRSRRISCASFVGAGLVAMAISGSAAQKKPAIPAELVAAKTVAIVNETGTPAVLDAATKEFIAWDRYKISSIPNEADLVVKFVHKNGVDWVGNMGFIEMDVLPRGSSKPVFKVKKSFRNIFQPQLRTQNCIFDFEDVVEGRS